MGVGRFFILKFMFSKKATKIDKIFVAFLENMNFNPPSIPDLLVISVIVSFQEFSEDVSTCKWIQ